MGNKENMILLWAMLVAVLAMATATATATEQGLFERTNGTNGLEKIIIRDRRGRSFEVYLYGGQVTSWKNEKGEELLFMSSKAIFKPPKAIRGGIPVLFPQYSNTGPLPSHGFVRNRFWKIDANPPPLPSHPPPTALVDLILESSQDDFKIWPHKFVYRLRVALGHRGDLSLTSRVNNTDIKPFNFTCAFHPYFSVSDISQIQVKGLHGLDYLDQQKNRTRFTDNVKAITFNSQQLDRLYLNTPNKIKILDHKKKKTIVVHKEGQVDAVVWNPWEKNVSDLGVEDYRRFVAVESAAVEKPIILEPGQEWKGVLQVHVAPLI